MNQSTNTIKDQNMDVERIIMDTRIQLIIAEYKFAHGDTATAEACLHQIFDILDYKLPPKDLQDENP